MTGWTAPERALFALWMAGLVGFPVATLVVLLPQAPLLAMLVLGANLWMVARALRPRGGVGCGALRGPDASADRTGR
ncbi:MAG TPA: hypothetical protein EYP43_01460 [Thermoplasmata archaeon]|nr:hypothetical protein [Thermoplasmata archaeon]